MIPKKIFGWGLFALGILIIFWILYLSFQIFVRGGSAPEVFKVERPTEVTTPTDNKAGLSPEAIQQQLTKTINEKINSIIPFGSLPKLLNLISWSIFAGIVIFGGGKISEIGLKFLREGEA